MPQSTDYPPVIINNLTATIASSASLSNVIDLNGTTICGYVMPDSWTSADITFSISSDGINFYDFKNKYNSEVTHIVAASRFITLAPSDIAGIRYLKIRSGTSAIPVNQTSTRVITLISRGASNLLTILNNPSFSPQQLEGLQLWLDSSDTSTITKDISDKVSQINDKSGKNNNAIQGTSANQATWIDNSMNSKDTIHYDGTSDYMSLSAFSSILSTTASFSVFIAFKLDVADASEKILLASTIGSTNRTVIGVNINQHLCCATYDGTFVCKNIAFSNITSPHIVTMLHSSTNEISAFLDRQTLTLTTENPATSNSVGTKIGARTLSDLFWNGSISEIVIYNREVTTQEKTSVEIYLSNKWGVAL